MVLRRKKILDIKHPVNLKGKTIGYWDTSYKTGVPVAMVAFWQEYGTSKISPTEFYTKAMEIFRTSSVPILSKNISKAMSGKITWDSYRDSMAKVCQEIISQSVSSHGLVNTGLLRDSVDTEDSDAF